MRRIVPAPVPPLALALAATAALIATGCGGAADTKGGADSASASGGSASGGSVSLVAYSTPQVVYDEIIPAFTQTAAGEGVSFKSSFGASGDQSRAVEAGQKADVVSFSVEPDMTRLVKAGLVADTWKDTPTKGLVSTSLVSFIVRKGNPKHIRTWADLIRPGIKVLTPNPFTSGAAKWNLLAAYGQAAGGGKDPQKGLDYVRTLLTKHVAVQDKSGREALQNFTSGTGDVLLSYEYEATTAQKKGEDVDFVTPDDTIRIEIDIAKTKTASPKAQAFLDYVLSKPAQEKFVGWGYRPVDPAVLAANKAKFPDLPGTRGWPSRPAPPHRAARLPPRCAPTETGGRRHRSSPGGTRARASGRRTRHRSRLGSARGRLDDCRPRATRRARRPGRTARDRAWCVGPAERGPWPDSRQERHGRRQRRPRLRLLAYFGLQATGSRLRPQALGPLCRPHHQPSGPVLAVGS